MYMKKNKKHSLFFIGLVVLFLASCQEQQPNTISSLLEEMIIFCELIPSMAEESSFYSMLQVLVLLLDIGLLSAMKDADKEYCVSILTMTHCLPLKEWLLTS